MHDYIYYAMQNDYGLPEGEDVKDNPDLFQELICDFIKENGYSMRRNVGASQYKVDIAVLHPSLQDTYIAGIECDGENYTAARTARDRDFLRKDIMESMGWHIYHVWSLAWYKNPQNEKQRLLDFLENSLSTSDDAVVNPEQLERINMTQHSQAGKMDDGDIRLLTTQQETASEEHHLDFARYVVCNPLKAAIPYHTDRETKLASQITYVLENEQPIHIELLYKRLAVVFGRQKVTEPVKRSINTCMRRKLTGKIEIRDSFIYLNEADAVKARTQNGDERPIEYICPGIKETDSINEEKDLDQSTPTQEPLPEDFAASSYEFETKFGEMLQNYPDILDDSRKFTGLMKDIFPQNQLQARLMDTLYKMDIAQAIRGARNLNDLFTLRFTKRLVNDFGVKETYAKWAVSVWCVCYGEKILNKDCNIAIYKVD